jgi:multidrug resistance efflux pump
MPKKRPDGKAELRAKGFVSTSEEEAARTEAEVRRAACNTAKADVAQAEAKFKATRVEQGRTSPSTRPFDGTVAKIVGELGEYSTPSPPGVPTPPAIDLIDDSCLYVKAPMDEVDAPKISAGQPVRITLDALPGKVFPARCKRVAPYVSAVEKQARTVDIEVDFDNPAERRQAAGRLQRRRRDHPGRPRQGVCASRPRPSRKAARCWSSMPTAASWKSADQGRAGQLGIHGSARRLAGRRAHCHLARQGRASRPAPR